MSTKIIGDLTWVLQGGYPDLSGTDGSEQITEKYIATAEGLANFLPDYGSAYLSDDPFFCKFDFLTLSGRSVIRESGKQTYQVSLTYSVGESADGSTESVIKTEVEYNTQDVDIQLSAHENYRMCFNHVLFAKNGVMMSPTWFLSAVNGELSSEQSESYAWGKPDDRPPEGWYLLCSETKPGMESYRSGITTVHLIKRSTNKNLLIKDAEKDYTIQTPPDTFGRSGEWLRGGSSIRKNGKYYELDVTFINSKTIDRDYYHE